MLGVTTPALLAGLAGIAVPIAIHLWSHRPSRVIRVGSVKLLAQSRPARARRVALSDMPRLLLRVFIVALAALAAAGLAWFASSTSPAPVVLIDPALQQDASVTRLVDSLGQVGANAHWLAPGLPHLTAPAPPAVEPGTTWRLLAEADAHFPGATLMVAAPRAARHYAGGRPALRDSVHWWPVGDPPVIATRPDTTSLAVLLVAERGRDREARTLSAALGAIADTRPVRLSISRAASVESSAVAASQVVIVLGTPIDTARVEGMLGRGTLLIADSVAWPHAPSAGVVRWRASDGRPLLSLSPVGGGRVAQLSGTFIPASLPLVTSAAFADSLAAIVLAPAEPAPDQPLTDRQRTPSRSLQPTAATAPALDLAWLAALLALVGFAIERLWASRPRNR